MKNRSLQYLVLAIIAAVACMELVHWGDTRIDRLSGDAGMILRLTPAAAITEEERAMMETLSGCPAVQAMLERRDGDMNVAEDPAVLAAVEECLDPENAAAAAVMVLPGGEEPALVLSWSTEKRTFLLQKMGTEYFKTYSRGGPFGRRTVYEKWDNETVHQSVVHHWWFSWLTANR